MNIVNTHITISTKDLAKATQFYQDIFDATIKFADENASFVAVNDIISIMIMKESFFQSFVPNKEIINNQNTCAFRNTLTLNDKESVNQLLEKALSAGAKEFGASDDGGDGFMYSRNFEDLDGYLRQILWMNMSQMG